MLQPRHIAALAEFGISDVSVTARPKAAIISTGNELVPFRQSPPPGKLRNSSQPMLAALLHCMGADVVSIQTAEDSPTRLDAAIRIGLQADLLLLTGGVSVGLLDLVPAARCSVPWSVSCSTEFCSSPVNRFGLAFMNPRLNPAAHLSSASRATLSAVLPAANSLCVQPSAGCSDAPLQSLSSQNLRTTIPFAVIARSASQQWLHSNLRS
jgi:hypothetical protein